MTGLLAVEGISKRFTVSRSCACSSVSKRYVMAFVMLA